MATYSQEKSEENLPIIQLLREDEQCWQAGNEDLGLPTVLGGAQINGQNQRRLESNHVKRGNGQCIRCRNLGMSCHLQQMREVEADGVIYQRERDAPGQSCAYVPPGYHHQEKYRLGTFAQYPAYVPVKVTDMAAAGFYFTGYKDRVKCFSCGIAVESWMIGDDAMDKKWHKSDCSMALGRDPRNVAIPTPNFRSIFRVYTMKYTQEMGQTSNAQARGGRMTTNLTEACNNSGSIDITDVTSNLGGFHLSDSFPKLVFANITSIEHENFLKTLNLKSENDRRKTYSKWPSYPAPYLPIELAKEGFFYLGNLDRTQCFSCSGVLRNWAPYDDVREQHQKHFPHCRIVRLMDSGNIPMDEDDRKGADEAERIRIAALLPSTDSLVEPPDPSPEEQLRLAEHFPCQDPVNPHMRRIEKRIDTFKQGWPSSKVRATPEQIAKAGFFYLGESDKTKCYYCNGGLQNWDPNDEPWTEHAKWFPGCEFVIRSKGTEFVRRIEEAHPNLNRPYIRNPVSLDIPPNETRRTHQSEEPQQAVINIPQLVSMGFSRERIDRAIQRQSNRGGYSNTQDLINDLLEQGNENEITNGGEEPPSNEMEHSSYSSHASGPAHVVVQTGQKREAAAQMSEITNTKKTRTASPTTSEQALEENLREIEQTNICKKCKKNTVDVVLLTCGHLAACSECAPGIKRCPICSNKVSSFVKVFRV